MTTVIEKSPFIKRLEENPFIQKLKWILVMQHDGPERTITAGELKKIFGLKDDRKIRLGIRNLLILGVPVAANTETPVGYYVINNGVQRDLYAKSLRNRLIEDAKRRRDFLRAAEMWLAPAIQKELGEQKGNYESPVQQNVEVPDN